MSLTTHLQELKKKHSHLSDQVESELQRPGADSLHIVSLKKKKLLLKEEIARLS